MKLVFENIHNFTREGNPKKQMDIGQAYLDKKFIEEIDWFITYDPEEWKIIKLIKNYKGYPILIMSRKSVVNFRNGRNFFKEGEIYYIGTSTNTEYGGRIAKTPEGALSMIKNDIDEYIDKEPGNATLGESQQFTREGEPLQKMGIGQAELDRRFIEKVDWDVKIDRVNFHDPTEVVKLIKNYRGYPIVIVKWQHKSINNEKNYYFGVSAGGFGRTNLTEHPEDAERNIKRTIDRKKNLSKKSKEIIKKILGESQQFERGLDPKEAMKIGRNYNIKKLNNETAWDWNMEKYPTFLSEKIIDIVPYKEYLIKISKIQHFLTPDIPKDVTDYVATSNVGEEYPNTGPYFHSSFEIALEKEKKWIDEYLDSK